MTDTEREIVADIAANPTDQLPCCAMADLLAETGDDWRAFAYRWMSRTGSRPMRWGFDSRRIRWVWLVNGCNDFHPALKGRYDVSARQRARLDRLFAPQWSVYDSFATAIAWLAFRLDAMRIVLDGRPPA